MNRCRRGPGSRANEPMYALRTYILLTRLDDTYSSWHPAMILDCSKDHHLKVPLTVRSCIGSEPPWCLQ